LDESIRRLENPSIITKKHIGSTKREENEER
jgi:hypothetical protein